MEFPVILGIHSVAQDFKGSFRFEFSIASGYTQKLLHSIDQRSINVSKGRQWCLHSYLSFKIPGN